MKRASFLLAVLLTGCGTLPQPFYGNPGPAAAKLAVPPAPVLMVPTPSTALLGNDAAPIYARDLAGQLAAYDVPSVAGPVQKDNWHLQITATLSGNKVIPSYDVIGPDGKSYGKETGKPVGAKEWADGDKTALAQTASADAPSLSKLMTRINANIQHSNPHSLENRTPRIFIGTITGAPGDGDTSLPTDLSRALQGPNLEQVKDKQQADFTVTGKVKATPQGQGKLLVELDWTVRDTNNRVAGKVTQIHELSQSDVSPYWGDVAAAATKEAAGGILSVIQNEILKKTSKPEPAGK
ncbi:hypothetical protein [Acidocella sp.]|uniref:hypothetical protein n=1 Tax=Acidocella sp. TaxID=50710 RepID=UPI003CFC57FD